MISVSGLAALSTIGTILKEARVVNDLRNRLEVPGAESPALPELNSFDALPPRRLFLVEDHVDALRAFTRVLRREGFEVQEASNVSKAIAVTRPGDFLLSDIALPDGNGCDRMRRLSSLGIQGIAISGYGTAKDREKYKRAGFAESFVKPVDVKQVNTVIGRVMENSDGAIEVTRNGETADF